MLDAPGAFGVRGARRGLDPDHLGAETATAQCDRDAARQSPAPKRNQHGREILHLVRELQPEGPLASDHVEVVERVHKRRPGRFGPLAGECETLVHGASLETHGGAETRRLGGLRRGGVERHEHLAGDAAYPCRLSQRPRVVAGARRHEARARRVAEPANLVQCAANLERPGELQALSLRGPPALRRPR